MVDDVVVQQRGETHGVGLYSDAINHVAEDLLQTKRDHFLILPDWHMANLGSRVLGLCEQRLVRDWEGLFGHRVLLMETFVDAQRFRGTVYRAANWVYVGNSTRKKQRADHLAEQRDRLAAAAFSSPVRLFDGSGESFEVHRETFCVSVARLGPQAAGVARKT